MVPGENKRTVDVPPGVHNAKTFFEVGKYLFDQAVLEVEHGIDPTLTAYRKKPAAFAKNFKSQFVAYAQLSFPFNTPIGTTHPKDWWSKLEGSEHGGIIAVSYLLLQDTYVC